MAGRSLNGYYLDKLFKELTTPKSWTELKKSTGIPERTLTRLLERMTERWKAAVKLSDGRYVLSTNQQTYQNYEHYEAMLLHSEKLIPGIECLIFNIKGEFANILSLAFTEVLLKKKKRLSIEELKERGVKTYSKDKIIPGDEEELLGGLFIEHLKTGYPGTYDTIKSYEKLSAQSVELEKIQATALARKLPEGDYKQTMRSRTRSYFIMGGLDPKTEFMYCLLKDVRKYLRFNPNVETIPFTYKLGWLRLGSSRWKIKRDAAQAIFDMFSNSELLQRIKESNQLKDEQEEIRENIIAGLESLKHLVKAGRPLEGRCLACMGIKVG